MLVTGESAGLKLVGLCYAMGFIGVITTVGYDDSWSNSEPDSEADLGRCWCPHCWMHHPRWLLPLVPRWNEVQLMMLMA